MGKRSHCSILGINAFHGDAAACLVVDGQLVAAIEEERLRRVRHWAGFPAQAVRSCLEAGNVAPRDLTHVAINRDPGAHLLSRLVHRLLRHPSWKHLASRLGDARRVHALRDRVAGALDLPPRELTARFHAVEHHLAHVASSYLLSPFPDAAVVSVDGFGDFSSMLWGEARGTEIEVGDRVLFPHSLGLFYRAMTQFLGFPQYGDEDKLMGLAAYGTPRYEAEVGQLVRSRADGRFALRLSYFRHQRGGAAMTLDDGAPRIEPAFSPAMTELLGPPRRADEPITERHQDLAASVQAVYESRLFHLLNHVAERTGNPRLCLAGGCAMNSVANGRIRRHTPFHDLYIQPAAGDAGGALGAAYVVWNQVLGESYRFPLRHAFFGPDATPEGCRAALKAMASRLGDEQVRWQERPGEDDLCRTVAGHLEEGKVVGWFQGRAEWGPRALGHRSILADPRRPDMRERINVNIKRREDFRPLAPAVLEEAVGDWFEEGAGDAFMLQVSEIRPDCQEKIPAVTHVDGTGRLQVVSRPGNPLFHRLIRAFADRTGVPILLNTSFHENEPIVSAPEEALDCFLRTRMDVLVLGPFVLERDPTAAPALAGAGEEARC